MRLHIEEGQYWISGSDPGTGFVLPVPGGASGLAGIGPGLAVVITGTQFGNVTVGIQPGQCDPGLDAGPWAEVTEFSLAGGPGGLTIGGRLVALPAAASYRIRVHARGRDAGAARDVVTGKPVEEHLLQIWPAPPAPETVHKTTDDTGAAYRYGASLAGPDPRLPHGQQAWLDVRQPLTAADRAAVELLSLDVSRHGCTFTIRAVVDVSGMTAGDEIRARKAVDGWQGATFPGSTDDGPLRVVLRFGDGRITEFSADTASLPPGGPAITPCASSNYPEGASQVAEESFWAWPLPPAEPFTLMLDWPAAGIGPASVTVDGAMIAEAAAALPPD